LSTYLFGSGAAPENLDSADVNDDGFVNIADIVALLAYLYQGGNAPPAPFPTEGFDAATPEDDLDFPCYAELQADENLAAQLLVVSGIIHPNNAGLVYEDDTNGDGYDELCTRSETTGDLELYDFKIDGNCGYYQYSHTVKPGRIGLHVLDLAEDGYLDLITFEDTFLYVYGPPAIDSGMPDEQIDLGADVTSSLQYGSIVVAQHEFGLSIITPSTASPPPALDVVYHDLGAQIGGNPIGFYVDLNGDLAVTLTIAGGAYYMSVATGAVTSWVGDIGPQVPPGAAPWDLEMLDPDPWQLDQQYPHLCCPGTLGDIQIRKNWYDDFAVIDLTYTGGQLSVALPDTPFEFEQVFYGQVLPATCSQPYAGLAQRCSYNKISLHLKGIVSEPGIEKKICSTFRNYPNNPPVWDWQSNPPEPLSECPWYGLEGKVLLDGMNFKTVKSSDAPISIMTTPAATLLHGYIAHDFVSYALALNDLTSPYWAQLKYKHFGTWRTYLLKNRWRSKSTGFFIQALNASADDSAYFIMYGGIVHYQLRDNECHGVEMNCPSESCNEVYGGGDVLDPCPQFNP